MRVNVVETRHEPQGSSGLAGSRPQGSGIGEDASVWAGRRVVQAVVLAACATLLVACGARPSTTARVWDEPLLMTSGQYRDSTDLVRAEEWLELGVVPGEGTDFEDMSRWALIDLHTMLAAAGEGGAPPAGAAGHWGYFWPRDGAFIALALDRTGHSIEARKLIDFIARLPFDAVRGFDARYLLNGGPVIEDPRGPQSDGCGWVLWAIGSMSEPSLPKSADGLRTKCLRNILRLTSSGWLMPPPSPDYWEIQVDETTLGTAAPMLAGLRAIADHGPSAERWAAGDAAQRFEARLFESMGPALERFGDHGGLDAAVAMLMPPFGPEDPRTTKRWLTYQSVALRDSGGLAPGEGWKSDGTSWTPQTALVAYTAAASGRDRTAERWLEWLDEHRVPWGSLPEKVNRSGDPAGPAPLLWTSALVLLTLDALEQSERND